MAHDNRNQDLKDGTPGGLMVTKSFEQHLVLGTAGHIDHGKSSLIKALTGVDPDRLVEEKRRGITIELGFARLELPDGTTMGVVDVPGHERFVRQMIAGATGIDVALLCIAADDGIMPQTLEHIAVLEVLGVRRCVVALTKRDLVDDSWLEFITEEVYEFLDGTVFSGSPVVAVSSRTKDGLEELRSAILSIAHDSTYTKLGSSVRFPIDRVFSIKGSGTVVTGTLWSGEVATDTELELLPTGTRTRIRSVQMHGEQVDTASAGNRVALNLSTLKTNEVHPGNFLATPGSIIPTDRFDAWFTYLDTAKSGKPLKSGTRIHIAHGTREIIGRILFMDGRGHLMPNESDYAQLRLEEPLPVSWQDRFVVRLYSPVRVAGGGMVLHCHPRRRTNLLAGEVTLLEALHDGDTAAAVKAVFPMLTIPVNAEELAKIAGVDVTDVEQYLDAFVDAGKVLRIGDSSRMQFFSPQSVVQKGISAIENTLMDFHTANPTLIGIPQAALLQLCRNRGMRRMGDAAFQALLDTARDEGRALILEGYVSHPRVGGDAKRLEEQEGEKLFGLLEEAGTTPPTISELIVAAAVDSSLAHRALGALEKQGLIQRINKDFCFTVKALADLEAKVREHLRVNDSASVTELKDAMQTSRKYAVSLLEFFDAQGVTRRDGDVRRLR